jgi:hypothetical protein
MAPSIVRIVSIQHPHRTTASISFQFMAEFIVLETNFCRELAELIYEQYLRFNDEKQRIFREMIVAKGTEMTRRQANQCDLIEASSIVDAIPFAYMLTFIEIRDKYSNTNITAFDIFNEILAVMDDIIFCPRETVRFFHRRNSCHCLKEIYYKLKDETKRTTYCANCHEIKSIKEMLQCKDCKLQWCSMECQVINRGMSHKEYCRGMKARGKETSPIPLKVIVIVVVAFLTLAFRGALSLSRLGSLHLEDDSHFDEDMYVFPVLCEGGECFQDNYENIFRGYCEEDSCQDIEDEGMFYHGGHFYDDFYEDEEDFFEDGDW